MKLTYDGKSFLLGGDRIWITGGEIHYFRFPRSEWREVLFRAKRAGLNTICTYVPWNFHEFTEGQADFAGDKDLAAYMDLIGELGMYAMLRPGPYICSEWDGGGIPAWLCASGLRRFREDDPIYMAAVESWFDRLIPIISERQITRGGPVITIQNENEYPGGWDASMRRYLEKINAIYAKHGIDIPVLACNVHGNTETTVKINDSTDARDQFIDESMILTYNHHVEVEPVYDLKRKQPNAPLITTEFWCGAPIYWGNQITDWPNRLDLTRAVYEYTSSGTQVCYYMFEGGTNFGFWGGNNIVTSYASGYPVGEAGKLTDKYYAVRPVNLFIEGFSSFFMDSEELEDRAGIQYGADVRLVVREGERGAIAFLSTHGAKRELPITTREGKQLTVHLGEVAATVLPIGLQLFDDVTVDYSNLCLLTQDEAKRILVLYGPAGTVGVVSVNGVEQKIPVLRRKVQYSGVIDGVSVIVVDEELARRCWIVDEQIVFGPDYIAETLVDGGLDLRVSEGTPDVTYLDADGLPVTRSFKHEPREFKLPELGEWKMTPCPEVVTGAGDGWSALEQPCSHEQLGVVQGYLWYSAELECEEDGVETMLLSHTPTRVAVFVNGQFCGIHAEGRSVRMRDEYGHPADWAFEELTVRVKKGTNRFVFLSDDLGHNYDVPISVGIQGPVVVGSRRVEVEQFIEVAPQPVSDDAFNFLYNRFYREQEPLPGVEFELALEPEQVVFIMIHGVKAWVTVNGEEVLPMSYPDSPWTMFSQIKRWITWQLPEPQAAGQACKVRIQYAEPIPTAVQENIAVYVAPRSGQLTNWQWKQWTGEVENASAAAASHAVDGGGQEAEGLVVLLPVGTRLARKGRLLRPAYLQTQFKMPEGDRPVYLKIGELQKGQIYMNGHNIGRFWAYGGTQDAYYLPRSWMKNDNELVIFEELGLNPQQTSLAYGESGSWTSVQLSFEKVR
ncbi:glycosyl hydrolase family 35 [Paenibacillus taihuensis]|uniref:Beta-galactosidase n=1 Tax=Paenibacillus taihuensis TaxID=1156355 RepID=A0A3D9SPT8_9BACL|nr:beta-galactosidase [Paenibacillus taihuensis]REE94584.1 glycosyl hydrolase family 35 [Paenibacillus taihuensis]